MMKRILTMAILAASVVACDPYGNYDFKSGTPTIKTVSVADYDSGFGFTGTATGAAWTVDLSCSAVCDQIAANNGTATGEAPGDYTGLSNIVVFVTFDRQIDGGAVQTAVDDCAPAGDWLTVTGSTLGAGEAWYSCYAPSSPTNVEGGSAVLFVNTGDASGWSAFTSLADPATDPSIHLTGTAAGASVDVTVDRVDTAGCAACP
jgi:hypothetical protein